jgi:Uma2 family endonuclease
MVTHTAKEAIHYTYEDYKDFPDEFRCEIIDGLIYDMTPAPSMRHQEIAGELYRIIGNHLKTADHRCRVFIAPADVILAQDQVVQPDIFIVCDRSKIEKHALVGAPDVVFEILSPSTSKKDRTKKMDLYRRFEVSEYILVDPENELVEEFMYSEGRYWVKGCYEGDGVFSIDTISLEIAAKDLFPSIS